MGSPCSVNLYCLSPEHFSEVLEECLAEVHRLESKYSRYLPTSLLSKINDCAGTVEWTQLDSETRALLKYANVAYEQSDGMFDVTSGVLRNVWNFKTGVIPDESRIQACLAKIGWHKVEIDSKGIRLPQPGMEIDFGGLVKEYAADTLRTLLHHKGVEYGMIDLGGDIAICGPHPDGTPWNIGIRHPERPDEAIAIISLHSGGLASSGNYARCFEFQNKRYSHLLNPKTGWPVQGMQATSIWAPQCIVAGSLATIAMLKEQDEAVNWLNSAQVQYVCMDTQNRVFSTIK